MAVEGVGTLWMGNHGTCCTPGLACSAQFGGDWPWSPHSVPLFHTKVSRLCHWSSGRASRSCIPTSPITLGDSGGNHPKETSDLWVKIVEHSSLLSVLHIQPMMLESHEWKYPVGQCLQSSVEIFLKDCGYCLWWNCRNVSRRIPSRPLLPGLESWAKCFSVAWLKCSEPGRDLLSLGAGGPSHSCLQSGSIQRHTLHRIWWRVSCFGPRKLLRHWCERGSRSELFSHRAGSLWWGKWRQWRFCPSKIW